MGDYTERRILEKCNEIARDVRRVDEAEKANQKSIAHAFNRMAEAIENLAVEVRQLREEMHPQALDKPKLPTLERGV